MMRFLAILATIVFATSPAIAFDDFETESAKLDAVISCPDPDMLYYADFTDLYSCIYPGADVVKVFINEDGFGQVENVKVMWNDWTRDTGYGVHTDKVLAEGVLWLVADFYAPEQANAIREAYRGTERVEFLGPAHKLTYTYDRGPAIDERLLTISRR